MEVNLTPEQQIRLHQVATRTGKKPQELLQEGVNRILDHDEQFLADIEEGRAARRRGDLIEHDEVVERIERILRS